MAVQTTEKIIAAERELDAAERLFRTNSATAEESRRLRNDAIRRAKAAGMTQAAIARRTGLIPQRISQIIAATDE